MRISRLLAVWLTSLVMVRYLRGQGTFQNLDFEEANIPPNPGSFIAFTNAFPGWIGSLGQFPAPEALYNGISLGFAEASIIDSNQNAFSSNVIAGNFTAIIS